MSSFYKKKEILAPMVRIGTLPTRLLSLRFGADIAYTEEMIDFKMLKTVRLENELLGTVDYVLEDGTVAFRTCPEEKSRVVFQLGTSHPKRALRVAKMVERDVAAIDINMGCPKTFSVSGGMGAALLKQPELVKSILTELVTHLTIPVTCKIRCLDTIEDTIKFAKMCQSTGIAAIGLHGRTKDERQSHKCREKYIKRVAEALDIPVIANGGSGDIKCYEDIERFRLSCGASSVMVARAAEWNVSIFRKSGLLSKQELINTYIHTAIDVDNHWTNTKYCIQQILGSDVQHEDGTRLLASKCATDIYEIYDMMEYYSTFSVRKANYMREKRLIEERGYERINNVPVKISRDDSGLITAYESNYFYERKESAKNGTPKMALFTHLNQTFGLKSVKPSYTNENNEDAKRFRCVMEYEGVKYMSNRWYKKRVWAEHAASQIYMWIHNVGQPKPSDENPTSLDKDKRESTKETELIFNRETIAVTATTLDEKIIRYSTDHTMTWSDEVQSCDKTPLEIMCAYLLDNKLDEPEYDHVEDKAGRHCVVMRHQGVEYSSKQMYDTKKKATNSVIQLYLLINDIQKLQNKRSFSSKDTDNMKKAKLSLTIS